MTYVCETDLRRFRHFNSHAHVERDPRIAFVLSVHYISTHTLTWSVTREYQEKRIDRNNFNSHAHVERDRGRSMPTRNQRDFNSHAHVERDNLIDDDFLRNIISTHTLTWSVTWRNSGKGRFEWISTHTLTWSVTETIKVNSPYNKFQLTRSRGA